ncbi:alpha/beta hydrolase [Streptomyces sp. NPDC059161]|uniref:alpha/beta hydrolase n=1 Tax=Streptomyces sp. NPDC059161 TaxID=3346749 RepID=UPI00369E4E4A
MGLTSNKVLVLAVFLAVVLFAVTIWLWPRLARRSWKAVTGRIGLLLATQLAIFASVGLAANNSFLFYGSWADLFGQEQDMGTVVDHSAGGTNVQVIDKQKPETPGAGKPALGGEIQKIVLAGAKSKITSPAYVYLPPEYFQKAYENKTFPAAIVLTGYPGTAENLLKGLRYPKTAWTQAKQKKMQPMILIMMRPTVAGQRDTECVDIPDGPQTETFFAKDVPGAISANYRVGTKAQNWGFIGDSTGGYCALKIGMHHPAQFAASAGLSAYYKAADDPTTGDLFHGNKKEENRANLLWSLDHLPQGKSSFLVTTSLSGEDNLKPTRSFIAKVKAPGRVSSITLDSGGHNFNTWRREIPPTLEWMSGRLSAN